jgi:cell division transport system permease protein
MRPITLVRVLKLGWANYWRNRGLSISASLILMLTLLIVLFFVIVNSLLGATSVKIRDKFDMQIRFDDAISEEQIKSLQDTLATRPETREVHYVDKEEARLRFQNIPGVSERTKQLITPESNPLRRSLEVKTSTPADLEKIDTLLHTAPWSDIVYNNSYAVNKATIQKLSRFERGVTTAGIILSIIFIAISMIVVMNTIRLAIFARREEIEIMRLVGANNIFIRIPFVVEAILYGIVAAALAVGAMWLIIDNFGGLLKPYLGEIDVDLIELFQNQLPTMVVIVLFLGCGLAVVASLLSIQRYLKR